MHPARSLINLLHNSMSEFRMCHCVAKLILYHFILPAELWHIQEEDGTLPDKLTEDTLYEVHVMVEDGGEFDLSDTEKEIKIAVILGNK